ncbi:aldo/keto reductase [Spirochaeta dissipatitropha]
MIKLSDGHLMPALGLGTWELTGQTCIDTVCRAIESGYRHIDTAFMYNNHEQVAEGIRLSGIDRSELFITTKIPPGKLRPEQVRTFEYRMLKELDVEYLDLLLVHWPNAKIPFSDTLNAFADIVKRKRLRSIGISNFNSVITSEAAAVSPVPIVTNQVEYHPHLKQEKLLRECRELDILITAYSPLAHGQVLNDPCLNDIASQHNISAAQVSIAWLLSKGMAVIPKASSSSHLSENLQAATVSLTPGDIALIDAIPIFRRTVNGHLRSYPFDEEIL